MKSKTKFMKVRNQSKLSLCNHCYSMTYSYKRKCNKCGKIKVSEKQKLSSINNFKKASLSNSEYKKMNGYGRNYRFNNVKYARIHSWLNETYGYPIKCEFCGKKRDKLKNNIEWACKDGKTHKRNKDYYLNLCHSCHYHYDNIADKIRFKRGIRRTAEEKFEEFFRELPQKARKELIYNAFGNNPMTINVVSLEVRNNTTLGIKILKELGFEEDE